MGKEIHSILFYSLIALFALIVYQDIRYRGIHWLVFPLLILNSIAYQFENIDWMMILQNLAILAVLLGGLTLYLFVREKRLVNMTRGYFSLGDILFLLAIVPLFETNSFLLFFTAGTALALVFHIIASMITIQKNLPYAGYMAISAAAFLLFSHPIHSLLNSLTGA